MFGHVSRSALCRGPGAMRSSAGPMSHTVRCVASTAWPVMDAATAPPEHIAVNIRGMKPSATLAINEASTKLQQAGKLVYKFGLGQSPFPVPDKMVAALQAHAAEKDYLPVAGLPALQDAIASWLNRNVGGREHTASDVVIGPGSKELLFLSQLVYNAELVLPMPSWVSYQPQAHIIGRPCSFIPCTAADGWKLKPAALDAACRGDTTAPRLMVLNYPSNPTGATYNDDELAELAEVFRRYRILVLSDEIYGKLTFDGSYTSLAKHYPEGTVIMNGASKWLGSGGWRVGFAAFPKTMDRLRAGVCTAASETFTSVSAPLQYGAIPGFQDDPEIESYIDASARVLHPIARAMAHELRKGGAQIVDAQGGFYVVADFSACKRASKYTSAAAMCVDVLTHTGVAMLPGSNFGFHDSQLCSRMAFVDFDGAEAIKNLGSLPDVHPSEYATDAGVQGWLQANCPKVMDGARKLAEFMDGTD